MSENQMKDRIAEELKIAKEALHKEKDNCESKTHDKRSKG